MILKSIGIRHLIKKAAIIIIILPVAGLIIFRAIRGFLPLPIVIRNFMHLAVPPTNLYQPIVEDKFLFTKKGFSKTYNLNPTYLDFYQLGFFVDQNGIESTYKFKGKLKAEFFWRDKLLFDNVITSMNAAWYKGKDMTRYKQIALYEFEIPLQKKYIKDISVKITVLEPDPGLEKINDSTTLYIAVSGNI